MKQSRKIFTRAALFASAILYASTSWAGIETGVDAYNGGDYAMALHEFMPLAEHGNARAQTYLGIMYANGQGVTEDDVTAILWYTRASMAGDTEAQLKLSDMYSLGKGIPADDTLATYWKWRAAVALADKARIELDTSLQKSSAETPQKPNTEPASATRCAAPPYKHDAEHFGEVGTTEVAFLVDANGKTLKASILDSSGWPRLDRLARDSWNSCTFSSGKAGGTPVPGIAKMFYEWDPK